MSPQSNPFFKSFSRASGSWLLGLALAFGLLSAGDRSVWSAAPGNSGVDPLEILNLSVRPNAIFVLDSSGSTGTTALARVVYSRRVAPGFWEVCTFAVRFVVPWVY